MFLISSLEDSVRQINQWIWWKFNKNDQNWNTHAKKTKSKNLKKEIQHSTLVRKHQKSSMYIIGISEGEERNNG